ncbi:hypothetical protein [Ruminococcus sp.]|uniref:hypothetical protein n=1 Tax=Ruminococcus sp. TaxID=41978 RepID=UPI00388E068E
MKRSIPIRLLSCLLTAVMMFTSFAVAARAEGNSGKYLKDVFIAYGEKRSDADNWLTDNGWEIIGDLNDGKTSNAPGFHNAVAVMGIKRTDDVTEAITDMATMNMSGGYSFDDYESLVKQKRADITEFINTFVPVLNEYRDNYNGKGSESGKKRAQMAHDILNKFYDGDPEGEYAVNDTGKPLGDLFLNKTKTELGDDAYNALSAEEKRNTADLEQIILESTGPAVSIIKQALALATDTAEDSWLDRLSGLTGDELVDRIAEFAPEAEGQDLAPSAAMNLLASHFEDYSKRLAGQWSSVREDILWFEKYCNDNNLRQEDGEDSKAYSAKIEKFFNDLQTEDQDRYLAEKDRFSNVRAYYYRIKQVSYSGDWGETLLDFFRPADEEADYREEYSYFAPLAAALSNGQRAALEFLSLSTLLRLGMNSKDVIKADLPSVDSLFESEDGKALGSISIYSGMNRAIFRKGVALTSDAQMQKSLGKDPYDRLWDEGGFVDIASYATLGAGAFTMITGAITYLSSFADATDYIKFIKTGRHFKLTSIKGFFHSAKSVLKAPTKIHNKIMGYLDTLDPDEHPAVEKIIGAHTAGKWLMGIGGAIMVMAAAIKGVQIYKYYNRTFTAIPTMIVDEADIVTYTTDSKGNQVKNIEFDQFAYYEVVKCNRQEVGIHTNAQDGVDKYKEWGCGDAADLNADIGKQWLAMYVNRSQEKGSPILADSLTIQKKNDTMPSDCNGNLHMFTFKNAVKIDDTTYSYRDDNEGMYLFWKGDEKAASATASTFSGGYLALVGIGGLALGILGTTLVLLPKLKKKKEEEAAQTANKQESSV